MAVLQSLLDWAQSAGVQLDGIAPQALPGRGTGVVATRNLKVCFPHDPTRPGRFAVSDTERHHLERRCRLGRAHKGDPVPGQRPRQDPRDNRIQSAAKRQSTAISPRLARGGTVLGNEAISNRTRT